MDNYVLSCCSTADLTKAHFDSRNIRYICFHYALGDTEYPTISVKPFLSMNFTGVWRRAK